MGYTVRKTYASIVGFEVLTAAVIKSSIFWDITPCSPLKVNGRFGETSSRVTPDVTLALKTHFHPWSRSNKATAAAN
jgi:hypothetical protein